jgi:alpha-galactosidase
MMPKVRKLTAKLAKEELKNPSEKAKPRYNFNYQLQMFDIFGALPTAVSHTKEYVPYFQGYGVKENYPEPLRVFNAETRQAEMDAAWAKTEEYATGKRTPKQFYKDVHDDHATDIIESMWGGLGKAFYINSANRGAVTNLPYDAFIELRSDVDMNGPRPQPFGEMPRGVLALQHQVLDTHELTAEAAVTGDKAILRRAMLTDPICNNIGDADACIEELLEAEKDILPSYWYSKKKKK